MPWHNPLFTFTMLTSTCTKPHIFLHMCPSHPFSLLILLLPPLQSCGVDACQNHITLNTSYLSQQKHSLSLSLILILILSSSFQLNVHFPTKLFHRLSFHQKNLAATFQCHLHFAPPPNNLIAEPLQGIQLNVVSKR